MAFSISLVVWLGTSIHREQKIRKYAEDSIKLERVRAELILASAPNATVMCDSEHGIVYINPEAEQMFGWTHQEMVGQKIEIVIPERFREQHQKSMEDAVEKIQNRTKDWLIRHNVSGIAVGKNQEEFPVDMSISVIKHAGKIEFIARITNPDKPHPPILSRPLPPIESRIKDLRGSPVVNPVPPVPSNSLKGK